MAARIDLGLALYKKEQYAEAVKQNQAALDVEPNNCIALVNLANAQRQVGDVKGAVVNYKRVLELEVSASFVAVVGRAT